MEWVSGEDFIYDHWGDLQPDYNEGKCAYMHRHDEIGYWRVTSCDEKFA